MAAEIMKSRSGHPMNRMESNEQIIYKRIVTAHYLEA